MCISSLTFSHKLWMLCLVVHLTSLSGWLNISELTCAEYLIWASKPALVFRSESLKSYVPCSFSHLTHLTFQQNRLRRYTLPSQPLLLTSDLEYRNGFALTFLLSLLHDNLFLTQQGMSFKIQGWSGHWSAWNPLVGPHHTQSASQPLASSPRRCSLFAPALAASLCLWAASGPWYLVASSAWTVLYLSIIHSSTRQVSAYPPPPCDPHLIIHPHSLLFSLPIFPHSTHCLSALCFCTH